MKHLTTLRLPAVLACSLFALVFLFATPAGG